MSLRSGEEGRRPGPVLLVAHRGASAEEPEHTIAAIRRAVEVGADGIECDIRLTADRVPVLLHDASLDRTTDTSGPVSRRSAAELATVDAGDGRPPPTLAALLDELLAAPRPVGLLVETKHPSRFGGTVERAVVDCLRQRLGPRLDRTSLPFLAVMSFSPLACRRLRRLAPELTRVQLRRSRVPAPVLAPFPAVGLALRLVRAVPKVVARLRRRGLGVYVWTVDAPADVRLCERLGVDILITNDPAGARAVLERQ